MFYSLDDTFSPRAESFPIQ